MKQTLLAFLHIAGYGAGWVPKGGILMALKGGVLMALKGACARFGVQNNRVLLRIDLGAIPCFVLCKIIQSLTIIKL